MHEISIAVSLVDEVLREAACRGALNVEVVHLKLGTLSGVDREALTFSYAMATENTSLAGTRLAIEELPVIARCSACGTDHSPDNTWEIRCPTCPDARQEIIQGREIELSALEVAT